MALLKKPVRKALLSFASLAGMLTLLFFRILTLGKENNLSVFGKRAQNLFHEISAIQSVEASCPSSGGNNNNSCHGGQCAAAPSCHGQGDGVSSDGPSAPGSGNDGGVG